VSILKRSLVCALLLLAANCTRDVRFAGQPIKKPVAVVLRVSDQAAQANDMGGIAAIVESVTQRLTEEGVEHQLYLEDDAAPPAPRIDIEVVIWHPGDEELRRQGAVVGLLGPFGMVGLIAGAGGIVMTSVSAGTAVVDCQAYAEGATEPTYRARFHHGLDSLAVDGQQSVGDTIGDTIGRELFEGKGRPKRFGP
jgi:hypothetical protein